MRSLIIMLAFAISGAVHAQGWPSKPVRIILPNAAGSGPDVIMRLAAERMEKILGQPMLFDNRPGANFLIAANAIAKAAPDGYTIGLGSATITSINPHLYKALPYDPERDFAYIGVLIDTIWGFFGVHPSVPAKTFAEFVALAKKDSGKYTYAVTVPSNGMWTQWVMKKAGVELTEVSYKTPQQAIQDTLTGRVTATTNGFTGYDQYLRDLRPLVAITAVRHPEYPDLPAIDEFYPGTGYDSWIGLIAPRGVPTDMVQRLNRALDTVVREPEFAKRALQMGWSNREGARTPKELAAMAREAHKRWGEIVREAGVKPE